jgi:hypothetical protein
MLQVTYSVVVILTIPKILFVCIIFNMLYVYT